MKKEKTKRKAAETAAEPYALKPCGCRVDALNRALTIWTCSCGHVQRAHRRPYCAACGRKRPANPIGWGCCFRTRPASESRCSDCGRVPGKGELVPCSDLHPELEHFAPEVLRGAFRARDGRRRCVGCLAEEAEAEEGD